MSFYLEACDQAEIGKKILLDGGTITIGRDPSRCNFFLNDQKVSRLHAKITQYDNGVINIEDLGSTHGTFVNGIQINSTVQVGPDDLIKVGGSTLRVVYYPVSADVMPAGQVKASISIGRDPANDLVIDHPEVSRHHARIDRKANGFYLSDLGSTHGTCLEGNKVEGSVQLNPSQWIQIRGFSYFFNGDSLLTENGAIAAGFGPMKLRTVEALSINGVLMVPFAKRESLKWLLGGLLTLVPIISFFAEGYRYRLIQNGYAGKVEMPEWENWGELFLKGLQIFLVRIIYLTGPAIVTFLFFSAALNASNPTYNMALTALIPGYLCYLFFGFFLPMGWARFAATGQIKEAFQFNAIFLEIRAVFIQYLTVTLLVSAMWAMVALFAQIPFLGLILGALGSFYIFIFSGLSYGDLYRCSQSRLQ